MGGLLVFLGGQSVVRSVRSSEKRIHIPRSVALMGVVTLSATTIAPYTVTPYLTRNENYADSVAYTGLIAEGSRYSKNLETYSDQLKDPASQFFALNKVIEGLGEERHVGEPDYCIYLASDPHGGGYRTLEELYEYDKELGCTPITAILGDFGDWSYEFEKTRDSVTQLRDLKGTIFTVKGNHDSYEFIEYIGQQPGVHNLTTPEGHKVKGVRIIGIPDPSFTPKTGETEAATQSNYDAGKVLAGVYEDTGVPTIVVAHERVALEGFLKNLPDEGMVNNILFVAAGHSHTQRLDANFLDNGMLYVNPGSVTGGGLRLLDEARGPGGGRLSATTIYLTKTDGRLRVSGVAQLNENFAGDDKTYSVQSLNGGSEHREWAPPQYYGSSVVEDGSW
jgi:predicted phosphodiesterase